LLVFLVGCSDEQLARKVLEEKRYHSIEITGYIGFGCPSTLFVHTGFVGKDVYGEDVKGGVCSSLFSDEVMVRH